MEAESEEEEEEEEKGGGGGGGMGIPPGPISGVGGGGGMVLSVRVGGVGGVKGVVVTPVEGVTREVGAASGCLKTGVEDALFTDPLPATANSSNNTHYSLFAFT